MTSPSSTLIRATNPWLAALWVVTAVAGLVGIGLTTSNSDPEALGYDAGQAALGHTLLGAGAVMLAIMLAAYAICWQLQRR